MPYLFKLSQRVARLRTRAVLVGAAACFAACETSDLSSLNSPVHPNFATSTGAPAQVTDLAATAMTDTSATLSFTEVDNGLGAPASYDIRVAPTPLVWGGTAPSVKQGTCATPVAGTAIGAKRICTVLGLTTGTAYDFQLASYRGTLMVNAVFGPLSNVASGTARTPAPPPVTTAPGTVTDLQVASATATSVTLSFTEVTGGSGQPASYDSAPRRARPSIGAHRRRACNRARAPPPWLGRPSGRSAAAPCWGCRRARPTALSSWRTAAR